MERYRICTMTNDYVPAKPKSANYSEKQYGSSDVYTKLRSYDTPLCKTFTTNKTFMEDVEPLPESNRNTMCKTNNQCQDNKDYTYLNKRGVPPSPYFKLNPQTREYFNTKADSRMFDERHNYYMQLDIPPIQVKYDLINDNISGNPTLSNYGKNYTSYKDVNAGQIQYYIDKDFTEPFYKPVYGIESRSVGTTYRDPMDSVKPTFTKEYPTQPVGCLSFVDDTTKFRDDIMSRQQRVHNQQKYELVYGRDM